LIEQCCQLVADVVYRVGAGNQIELLVQLDVQKSPDNKANIGVRGRLRSEKVNQADSRPRNGAHGQNDYCLHQGVGCATAQIEPDEGLPFLQPLGNPCDRVESELSLITADAVGAPLTSHVAIRHHRRRGEFRI
jgi:hypothetical protein